MSFILLAWYNGRVGLSAARWTAEYMSTQSLQCFRTILFSFY